MPSDFTELDRMRAVLLNQLLRYVHLRALKELFPERVSAWDRLRSPAV